MFTSRLPPPTKTVHADSEIYQRSNERIVERLIKQPITVSSQSVANKLNFQDFLPLRQRNFDIEIPLPNAEEIRKATNKTKKVFDSLLQNKLESNGTSVANKNHKNVSSNVVRYGKSGTSNVVEMEIVEAVQDPLQPSRKKFRKAVAPISGEEVTPIYNSSNEKKLTKEEIRKWNIPSAISAWKNPNGYTISLDKRLGGKRSLAPNEVSSKFTDLSDALELADKRAREELSHRNERRKLLASHSGTPVQERDGKRLYNAGPEKTTGTEHAKIKAEEKELVSRYGERRNKNDVAQRLRKLAYAAGTSLSDKVISGTVAASKTPRVDYDTRLYSKGNKVHSKNSEPFYDDPLFVQQDIENIYRTKDTTSIPPTSAEARPVAFTKKTDIDESETKGKYGLSK
ncbi:mRNA splicing protein PRP45 NDAI_0H01540 [Naumovozyma dairenensis CBS 421]|uniref:Pre-mRNA-processing protein 45 n=1 Tax=Naumovozyma dairenensis (strain ATCC 10597 / BCRC 20456 / CBS 421 / NBRC 0211 / NRRL Y-12639) TaxID=1071378 RepID=G0WEW7_NAUDC|nr:hypothetical protein NDAI_0H01540 [Naumovozyma dairenensis CBS 421]CCD26328.1 hypothetical protein NDAI_0H01540 [Naumovozyma dairenensis CBS 421]